MGDDDRIMEVLASTARCSGRPQRPHAETEIALKPNVVAECPICARRFLTSGSTPKIDRAVWPRES
jgi:hypothetical protein